MPFIGRGFPTIPRRTITVPVVVGLMGVAGNAVLIPGDVGGRAMGT